MVRVISVHHFTSQHIQTVEQPTACTVAAPNRLLLALTNNCVEVRDLDNESDVLFSFPSVDEVTQIVHCLNGDYVATLESKFNRQNKDINFVRVYINWNSLATLQQSKMTSSGASLGSSECGMVQPMRARIAGRVTPTTNQSELGSLEMIEIPVKHNPHMIQCCQVSGNLLIAANNLLTFYEFRVKSHDISKLRFIDFEELPMSIELTFKPSYLAFAENYVAAMNKDHMHLFKVTQAQIKDSTEDCNSLCDNDFNFKYPQDECIDFKKLVKDEAMNVNKGKLTVNLPSIVRENSVIHKHSPFTFCDKDMVAILRSNSPLDNISQNYEIQNLIQLKLIPILVENAQRHIREEFKSLILKPLYIDENLNRNKKRDCDRKLFISDYKKCLNSVVCMIATQQEGYLYHFEDSDIRSDDDKCIAVYPFTAPVYNLVMENAFLHALTETGLETYTLRLGHQLCRSVDVIDDLNVACPAVSESICLAGLRPFLGVEQILLSENHLVLLANADNSPTHSVSSSGSSTAYYWTLYNLELPTPRTVFNDISIVATVHRFTSTQTYCHLMSEAHMILRVALLLKRWGMTDDIVKLIIDAKNNNDDIVETYRTSCALLGDHYIICSNEEDFRLAIPYYKMARIMSFDVLKRVKKIQEQSNSQSTKGLLHYLKTMLQDVRFGPDVDKFYPSGSKQNFALAILELLENHNYEGLPNLILKSKILREYYTDKLIQILSDNLSDEYQNQAETYLALALLYIQKCNMKKAETTIAKINRDSLFTILENNWELLFENVQNMQNKPKGIPTFSEFTVILFGVASDLISELFVHLIMVKKTVTLSKFIKIFLEYLPSSIGSDGNTASSVLQKALETYFQQYFSKPENVDLSKVIYERGASEALKLLVRSYLSQIQILQLKEENNRKDDSNKRINTDYDKELRFEENDDTDKDKLQEKFSYKRIDRTLFEDRKDKKHNTDSYLFSNVRYEYLDKMPPFQIEVTSKLYQACLENYIPKMEFNPNDEADLVLKKLQALLCSHIVPKQVVGEVTAFLVLNETLRGCVSLQSIIMNTNDAVLLLIDECPQCLLQFGKDRFTKTDEWKFLIATIQRRILKLSQNDHLSRICFFHKKILKDTLTYVATSLTLDQLIQVFPQRFSTTTAEYVTTQNKVNCDNEMPILTEINSKIEYVNNEMGYSENDLDILNEIQNYEPYVTICKETMHANEIHKLITTTGQQLLCTLNL